MLEAGTIMEGEFIKNIRNIWDSEIVGNYVPVNQQRRRKEGEK